MGDVECVDALLIRFPFRRLTVHVYHDGDDRVPVLIGDGRLVIVAGIDPGIAGDKGHGEGHHDEERHECC